MLEEVFLNYTNVFYHLYCKTSLHILNCCLSENWTSEPGIGEIEERIGEEVSNSHSISWVRDKAKCLVRELEQNPIKETSIGQQVALHSVVGIVIQFQEKLEFLEKRLRIAQNRFQQ